MSDLDALAETYASIESDLGAPNVVVHNAVGGAFGDFSKIDPAVLERNFRINTTALLRLGQLAAPAMVERGEGAIVCTGNTSAYRGKNFSPASRRPKPHSESSPNRWLARSDPKACTSLTSRSTR